MDFLDPKKRKQQHWYLMMGYALTTIGVILATTILLLLAYGFGITKSGEIVQKGRIFVSSSPGGASISINGLQRNEKTNTTVLLENGRYTLKLTKNGYRSWERGIVINGGILERFDYPLLVPSELKTKTLREFSGQVPFASQSRDRNWILAQQPNTGNEFTLFDTRSPEQPAVVIDIPTTELTSGTTLRWVAQEWASDNRHVLLARTFTPTGAAQTKTEYIVVDRQAPAESVNVTKALQLNEQVISFFNGEYNAFYIFDTEQQQLSRASLDKLAPVSVLERVLAFKTYAKDKILYVTSEENNTTTVAVRLLNDTKTYDLGSLPANDTYFLDLARHEGAWYIAAGAKSLGRIMVYKNPIDSINQLSGQPLVPVQVLKVDRPVALSFSANTRFIMATNGQDFYTYDILNDKGYSYTAKEPLDAPQSAARWMDGHRLTYVSGGKVVMFDYDYTNRQTLQDVDSSLTPFFDRDYRYAYSFGTQADTAASSSLLQQTPLRIDADL